VLTERNDHLDALERGLIGSVEQVIALRAGLGKKQRLVIAERLARVPSDAPRVLLASGKCIGEGFDDPRLDTLFLTWPVSWRGRPVWVSPARFGWQARRLRFPWRGVIVTDAPDLFTASPTLAN
jgi:hypothetical protein